MLLHVPTIFVALFFSFALFVAALTFTRPLLGAGAELRLWVRSVWLLLASFMALFSRVFMPEWFAVLFGNGLIFASLYLMNQALHRFVLAHAAPRWQGGLMVLGWVGTAAVMNSPLPVRTVVVSCLIAAQLGPMVWLMLTRGWHAETALRTVGITLGLTLLALLLRVGNAILHPEDYAGYFQTSLGNGLTYLASFLFPLGAGYGFVMANLERTARRLDAVAMRDSLTGCLNRGAFDTLVGHSLQRVRREGSPASLIVLDLDNFKQINDTRGHPTGDAVLTAFAQALRERLRAADAFGRLGGDEFAVLLADTDTTLALSMAEVLRSTVEALDVTSPDGERLHITVSIGVATATPDGLTTAQALHAEADKSLYAAKQAGRNRAVRLDGGALPPAGRTSTLATGRCCGRRSTTHRHALARQRLEATPPRLKTFTTSGAATMVKSAHIRGEVSYREGDGPHINIPLGPCEIEETAQDVTFSWADGDTHGAAAIPITDFKRYVATRAIVLQATQPA